MILRYRGRDPFSALLGCAVKSVEIGLCAPQVVFHRINGAYRRPLGAGHLQESVRMVTEKGAAAGEILLVSVTVWPRQIATGIDRSLNPVHRRVVANRRRLAYRR